ncbi:sigma-B regulation protein RsbU (phosphoserine phosphatase) [Noviherbaspirillum humi]|uniref:Sigma-B regulation protein RsbU (Phosphoserine phosphatase) n=2 Tax=Noviherbaspirillum humi TaxID=1688639 RepID=A0A239DN01_9BURK|nr:sigma-B regulation protein RsbU (phosphoserine phosphatase) [Noviherbaspirillum humi]
MFDPPPIRALVVDDDPLILRLISFFLKSKGYAVFEASDGHDALRLLEAEDINLVITDWVMPGMDGLALCQAVRSKPRDAYVYLMMLTSRGNAGSLVEAMEAGVDDFLVKPFSPPELGARLHAALRVLALEAGLESRNRKLAEAYNQLSRELDIARKMLLGLLPDPSSIGPVSFNWFFKASSYVGGDSFDYFPIDGRYTCFYVVDVAGHGVSAAMLAFNTRNQIRSAVGQIAALLTQPGSDIGAVAAASVTEFNRRFMQMNETSLYFTIIFGILDAESGRVALVQAGHPAPLYFHPGRRSMEPIGEGGLPIGFLDEVEYEANVLQLEPGSRLYLYSDGVTECANGAGELFGRERMEEVLRECGAAPLDHAAQSLERALQQWRGSAEAYDDDVTFLALAY